MLTFPFYARCIAKRKGSPLVKGEIVKITGMAPEEYCMHEIFIIINLDGRSMAIPLSQIKPVRVLPKISQAVADWRYWVTRGYKF